MSRRLAGAVALALVLPLLLAPASVPAQWYIPQSDRDLRLTWNVERLGPSRALVMGEIQNLSDSPASGLVLRAEGLDGSGRVVSRARGFVGAEIPPRGTSRFEIRLTTSGSEQRYRVSVDAFEFAERSKRERQSP